MIKWLVHSFHPLHLKIHSEFVCTTGTIINGLLRNLMIPFECLVFFGFTENYKAVLLTLKWSVFAENLLLYFLSLATFHSHILWDDEYFFSEK